MTAPETPGVVRAIAAVAVVRDRGDLSQIRRDLEIARPLLVAAELRHLADELEPRQDRMRDEDGRGIRSSALGVAIVRLRERADELDPLGGGDSS